jgi:hypothetical protein
MLLDVKLRRFSGAVSGALFVISALLAAFVPAPAAAQTGEPIKIGYSMALTGGLAPNGRSALLTQKIWEEDTNAKGGLLGRPVKLIHYDDQTNPATVPGVYTKLLDIDKVDLIIGGYGTNLLESALPIAMSASGESGKHLPIRALPSLIRGGHPLRAAQDSYGLAALVRFISSPQFFS